MARTAGVAPSDRIANVVYSFVRKNIADGRIRPNEMLLEIDIAEELGVSRSPVREALQRLVNDGLVDLVRRRWIVHEFTEAEVIEIYKTRAILESGAAELAASAITDAQRAILIQFRESFERRMLEGLEQRVFQNNDFHSFVVECANSARLLRFYEMNNTYHFNFNLALLYTSDDLIASAQQHIDLIDAILAGDGARARELNEEHVLQSLVFIQQRVFASGRVHSL